jgi:hypothetical protein
VPADSATLLCRFYPLPPQCVSLSCRLASSQIDQACGRPIAQPRHGFRQRERRAFRLGEVGASRDAASVKSRVALTGVPGVAGVRAQLDISAVYQKRAQVRELERTPGHAAFPD